MPLTPADVHNVAFSKPPIGKRGYNEDEVDAFLDLVEAELARLIEENSDLREQVERLELQLGNAQAELEDARAAGSRAPQGPPPMQPMQLSQPPMQTTQVHRPVEPPIQRPPAGPPMAAPPPQLAAEDLNADPHVQAAKVLGLAQEMADRLTAEAKSEADGMLVDARIKSEQLLSEARAKSDTLVNEARTRAETMLNDARTRAETLERQSREKAGAMMREAERRQNEIIGSVQREKSVLEKKIDELRTFEREYRTRLKTYLESQLRGLEGRDNSGADARPNYASSGYGSRADAGS
jgi:DivIVA domain-containing protein